MALGTRSQSQLPSPAQMQDIILRPPKMGVVNFHNSTNPTSGLACVAPKQTDSFERRTELASDVIWISAAKNSTSAQNFRANNYLRSSVSQIAEDLGVSSLQGEGLQRVAETVSRVRDIAAHSYPWLDFSTDWSHSDLATSIAKILPPTGEVLASMESPLMQAHQAFSFVPDLPYNTNFNQTIYSLRVNRLRYAQYICATKVPTNSWRHMANMTKYSYTLDDFLNPEVPSLVEASIEFTTGMHDLITPALTAFGSSNKQGRQPIRKWISQIELAWLVEHANVHITSAFICDGSSNLSEQHQLPTSLTADPVYALSVAAGLVAQSHWVGLSSQISVRRPGMSATTRWVPTVTPAAVWLRAADRAYSFAMAKIVAQKGYVVSCYGYGGVSFFAPKDDIGALMALAEELGACHPCLSAIDQSMGNQDE